MKPLDLSQRGEWISRFISFAVILTAFSMGVLLMEPAAWAGGTVTSPTEASLRAAMTGGGTGTFACEGTITLGDTISNTFDTVLDGSGHQVTISGGNTVRVFYVNTNVTLTVINLTIANGGSSNGAGIWNDHGTVNATNCLFIGNVAYGTAGIPPSQGTGNGGAGYGGAIYNAGALNGSMCAFVRNSAAGGAGADGASVLLAGTPVTAQNLKNKSCPCSGLCYCFQPFSGDGPRCRAF
jgi:hypothetical protein